MGTYFSQNQYVTDAKTLLPIALADMNDTNSWTNLPNFQILWFPKETKYYTKMFASLRTYVINKPIEEVVNENFDLIKNSPIDENQGLISFVEIDKGSDWKVYSKQFPLHYCVFSQVKINHENKIYLIEQNVDHPKTPTYPSECLPIHSCKKIYEYIDNGDSTTSVRNVVYASYDLNTGERVDALARPQVHPVHDLLTSEIIQFLRELETNTIKQPLILLYGNGSNGKTTFVDILKKIKKCYLVPETFYVNPYCIDNIRKDSPDFILVSELEFISLEKYLLPETLNKLKLLGDKTQENSSNSLIPVILTVNKVPNELFLSSASDAYPDVKLIRFNNTYYSDDVNYAKSDSVTYKNKKALKRDDIINDSAMRIVTDIMCTKA